MLDDEFIPELPDDLSQLDTDPEDWEDIDLSDILGNYE